MASKAFPEKTRKLLSIVLASARPLTIEEMWVAVEVDGDCVAEKANSPSHQSSARLEGEINVENRKFSGNWHQDRPYSPQPRVQSLDILGQQLHSPFDNDIHQLCGHSVRIPICKIYFVHQTARSFLIKVSFKLDCSRVLILGHTIAETTRVDNCDRTWQPITLEETNKTLLKICMSYI